MGVPRAVQTDKGAEYIDLTFVDYCNGVGIFRDPTVPYTPQNTGPVESGLSRTIKVGNETRVEVNYLFLGSRLGRLKGM